MKRLLVLPILLFLLFSLYIDFTFPVQHKIDKYPLPYLVLIDNETWQPPAGFKLQARVAGTWLEDEQFCKNLGIAPEQAFTIEPWYLGIWVIKGKITAVQYDLKKGIIEIRLTESTQGYQVTRVNIRRLWLKSGQKVPVYFLNEHGAVIYEEIYEFRDDKVQT
ncbi:MAG: hypothetical protein JG781_2050 [Peptococcaceae bacterium]|jgi:hypothetical protein|nr:hypothetical protein [Peptococcaceae bacterium]